MKVPVVLAALLLLVSCNRDPNVAKKRYVEMGDNYYKREQYKQASLLYRNALRKDQRYGLAHYKLALTELKMGQPGPAAGELRRAIELLPANSNEHGDAAIKLADIYLLVAARDKQAFTEVETVAQDLLKKDPKSVDGHRMMAALANINAQHAFAGGHIDTGRTELKNAIAEFHAALAGKPGDVPMLFGLGQSLAIDQQYADAEKIFRDLIAQDKTLGAAYMQLYRICVIQNRVPDAESVLKLAVSNNPKEYTYLTLLARHYYAMKRREDMLKVLDQIKSHAKDNRNAYIIVGDFYYRIGDGDEAIRQYKEGIQNDQKRKPIYQKLMIQVLLSQGKKGMAADIDSDILKDNPKDNDARGIQAQLLLDKGEIQKALTELQGVVSGSPNNPVARFDLGRAHYARGEYEQARQQYAEAIRLRPDFLLPRLAMAKLQAARGDYEAALKTSNEVLQLDRGNLPARMLQAGCLMGMKRYNESRELLQALLKADPNSTDALFQLGVLNLVEQKYKDAEEAFRRDYSLQPANSRGLMGMVEVYMAENKEDLAIQTLENEIQKYPNRTDYHLALGNSAVRAGRYDLALAEFQKVVDGMDKKSKTAADVYLRIGETCRRKGDLAGAVGALQQARNLAPDSSLVIATLALALDSANRKQEARIAYEQCFKIDPRSGVCLNNLAYLLAENNGDLDQALTYAQRAKQLLPQLYEVSDTLGWIYLKKQLTDNAIDQFKDIVTKQPTHSTYRYHLGMAYAQKGDKPKAIQELNKALQSNPAKDESDKIKQLLQKLG